MPSFSTYFLFSTGSFLDPLNLMIVEVNFSTSCDRNVGTDFAVYK